MKNTGRLLTTGLTVLALVLASLGIGNFTSEATEMNHVTVGFIYDGDSATPYSANFMRAEEALRNEFGDRVTIDHLLRFFGRIIKVFNADLFPHVFGGVDVDVERIRELPQYGIGAAADDDAGLFRRRLADDHLLIFENLVLDR